MVGCGTKSPAGAMRPPLFVNEWPAFVPAEHTMLAKQANSLPAPPFLHARSTVVALEAAWVPTLRRHRGPQPSLVFASSGFTRNHAAYSAGRNTRVSTVPTIRPPMIEIAIEP